MSISTEPLFVKTAMNEGFVLPTGVESGFVQHTGGDEKFHFTEQLFLIFKNRCLSIYVTKGDNNPVGAAWEFKAEVIKQDPETITIRATSPLPRFGD